MSSTKIAPTTDDYQFALLTPVQFPLAKKFYKAARYSSKIGREDEVYVLRQQNSIIASLKLVKLDQYLILRSMVVSPEHRGQGIGLLMLHYLVDELENRECWCFPFDGLEKFYSSIGFRTFTPEDCPNIIKQKYQQYFSQGKKIFIMKRD